jgi:hypothetical protein
VLKKHKNHHQTQNSPVSPEFGGTGATPNSVTHRTRTHRSHSHADHGRHNTTARPQIRVRGRVRVQPYLSEGWRKVRSGARRKAGPTSPSPSPPPAAASCVAARRRAGEASRTKSPVKPSSARRSSCSIAAAWPRQGGGFH